MGVMISIKQFWHVPVAAVSAVNLLALMRTYPTALALFAAFIFYVVLSLIFSAYRSRLFYKSGYEFIDRFPHVQPYVKVGIVLAFLTGIVGLTFEGNSFFVFQIFCMADFISMGVGLFCGVREIIILKFIRLQS